MRGSFVPPGGVALAIAFTAALLAGCASSPPVIALPDLSPQAVSTTADAERALAATEAERVRIDRIWKRREYDCYQRFFVNRCLGRMHDEERLVEQHLRSIDIKARQVLREDDALRRNEGEAKSLAEAAAAAQEDASQRREAARARTAREAEAGAERARREAEDARRERERADALTRQSGREAQAHKRRQDKAREVEAAARRPAVRKAPRSAPKPSSGASAGSPSGAATGAVKVEPGRPASAN